MDWDGQERRNGDKKIAILEERLRNFMELTDEFRRELTHKLDAIIDKLGNLPCRERISWYTSMSNQMKFYWLVLALLMSSLILTSGKGIADRDRILDKLDKVEIQAKKNAFIIETKVEKAFSEEK